MPQPFVFDRSFELSASPDRLWQTLQQTGAYSEWWSWLRVLDGGALREGTTAYCVVQGPLPYQLRFDIEVQRIVEGQRVETHVRGDLDGPAQLEIARSADGSTARLSWSLDLRDTFLRPLSWIARPAMVWAHDRVIEMGLRQFERQALDGHGTA